MCAQRGQNSLVLNNTISTEIKLKLRISFIFTMLDENNYLCTYDLYGPVRNVFDAGAQIHYPCRLYIPYLFVDWQERVGVRGGIHA
jgi:hypothetical protein